MSKRSQRAAVATTVVEKAKELCAANKDAPFILSRPIRTRRRSGIGAQIGHREGPEGERVDFAHFTQHGRKGRWQAVECIRKDDPLVLKDMILKVQKTAAEAPTELKNELKFAILLCRIHLKGTNEANLDQEFSFFLRNKEGLVSSAQHVDGVSAEQLESVTRLANRLPIFRKLVDKIQSMPELSAWLQQGSPEQNVPLLWDESKALSPVSTAMHQLLLIQAFRPDRVIAAAHLFVSTVLGEHFMPNAEKELDFSACVEKEIASNTPALLCSVTGYDASSRVDDLAAELNKQISSIAIGSAEG